ncbi:glyoxalase (plasmid) [Halostagnicola larsenii XH-48]|uniref:Glyoxalase n=1 Tax=Halostagnicola larsenii XH-48 TaxID=797299 RepID=W0JVM6_9EURY|nr:VOC family protein [Halostagnicola larsenii]AHG01285.1 glyoxalase [Halostagnicola larsenii XH-48]
MAAHDIPIRVDHVGIAIESIEAGEPVLEALGCEKLLEEPVEDEFRWAYYELGDASRIELIAPIADGTFLTSYLAENGPGLHHVTLEVGDIEGMIETLERAGLQVVDYTEREDWSEAFVSPANPTGTLFQLMEYHESYVESRREHGNPCIGGARVDSD